MRGPSGPRQVEHVAISVPRSGDQSPRPMGGLPNTSERVDRPGSRGASHPVVRTGWPVGRVLYAEAWRPSIYECRCRHPPAIYPRTRAGRPRTCAHPVQARDFLILLQVGFTDPVESPRSLVVSYTTVSPLPPGEPGGGLFSVALSRESPRVGVTHHLALWSPDLPRRLREETTRSPGQPIRSPHDR